MDKVFLLLDREVARVSGWMEIEAPDPQRVAAPYIARGWRQVDKDAFLQRQAEDRASGAEYLGLFDLADRKQMAELRRLTTAGRVYRVELTNGESGQLMVIWWLTLVLDTNTEDIDLNLFRTIIEGSTESELRLMVDEDPYSFHYAIEHPDGFEMMVSVDLRLRSLTVMEMIVLSLQAAKMCQEAGFVLEGVRVSQLKWGKRAGEV